MTQPIPPTSPRVERVAAEMRKQPDSLYAYAIGRIEVIAQAGHRSDAEARAVIRDVLAALDLVVAERRGGTPQTWTVVYWRYGVQSNETCSSLDAAVRFLADGEEQETLSAVEVLGPDGKVVIPTDEIPAAAYGLGRWAPDQRAETLRALGGTR